jgi:hypothetical protein
LLVERVEVPHVLTVRAGLDGERVETWRVVIELETSAGSKNTYTVNAERDPDAVCAEVATLGRRAVGKSLGLARERARRVARGLACGAALMCPGIVACIEGAPCPFGIRRALVI